MTLPPLVTTVEQRWSGVLPEAVCSVAWSGTGRMVAVAADGSTMVDDPAHVTTATCADPIVATWVADERVAIADHAGLVVFAGSGRVATTIVPGVRAIASRRGVTVAGAGTALWVDRGNDLADGPIIEVGSGLIRSVVSLSSALWAVAAGEGLALVDVSLNVVDTRVELPGIVAVAVDADATVIVAGDVGGSLHLLPVGREGEAQELVGYPDAVRLIGLAGAGDHVSVIAVADDELTWWPLDDRQRAPERPSAVVAQDAPITALACDPHLVASGDADGAVRVWSTRVPDIALADARADGEVTALAWSPTGRTLVAGTVNGQVLALAITPGSVA